VSPGEAEAVAREIVRRELELAVEEPHRPLTRACRSPGITFMVSLVRGIVAGRGAGRR
jgi:hypothetical protein